MSFDEKMNNIIKKYQPQGWYNKPSQNIWQMYTMPKQSVEHLRLSLMMQGDFIKEIQSIMQVQNPFLYEQFLLKMAECSSNGRVRCEELLHCTAKSKVKSIVEENLDWRLTHRHKFGRGVSFSKSPAYANLQSSLSNGVQRAMIVCDVIIGYTQIGNSHTKIPDDSYDTTVSACKNVYVKYNDNEFYPKYVINYESYPVKTRNGRRFVCNH